MSCTSCSNSFGLLRKEVGCEVCGFSYCTKCCSKKTVTRENGETDKQLICNTCYSKTTSDKSTPATYSPPMAHKKRMAQMSSRSVSVGGMSWTNEKDKEIAERLQKLKRERSKDTGPSQTELEERLAKLKGMDPAKFTAPPLMVYRPEKRSTLEQERDLMKQITEEVNLDDKIEKPEVEIAARLARLRDKPVPPQIEVPKIDPYSYVTMPCSQVQEEGMDIDKEYQSISGLSKNLEDEAFEQVINLEKNKDYRNALASLRTNDKKTSTESDVEIDEDAEAEKIIKELSAVKIESTDMDEPVSFDGARTKTDNGANEDSDDEFPWCVICTEDAKIRCFGCDSDLYCMNCFRECHDSLDIRDHKTCPFLSPKKL